MICIDALWLTTGPVDMRAGTVRLLARVVQVFGAAQAHHGYAMALSRCQSRSVRSRLRSFLANFSLRVARLWAGDQK